MREEVPAIIHKLSLEWAMRNQADECLSPASLTNTQPDNTLPAANYVYSLEVDADDPLRHIFSSANLDRLSALTVAQHTLSPFTPSIPQSVFRSSTTLVSSLRHSLIKRRDTQSVKRVHQRISDVMYQHNHSLSVSSETSSVKAPESEPSYYCALETSPPESVHSAQSADSSLHPTLYTRRQRSSYLRRPHPPKRKVVRLNGSRSDSTCDAASSIQTTSEQGDYFSEPGGYRHGINHGAQPALTQHNLENRGDNWNTGSYTQSWNSVPNEKFGDNAWGGHHRFNRPPLKGEGKS